MQTFVFLWNCDVTWNQTWPRQGHREWCWSNATMRRYLGGADCTDEVALLKWCEVCTWFIWLLTDGWRISTMYWQRTIRMFVPCIRFVYMHTLFKKKQFYMYTFTIIDPLYRNFEWNFSSFMRICSKQRICSSFLSPRCTHQQHTNSKP